MTALTVVDTTDMFPTATSVPITWTAPSNVGMFDCFRIFYKSADLTVTEVAIVFADVDTYIVTGLGVGQTYTICVQALSGSETNFETRSEPRNVVATTGEKIFRTPF